jgi:hypothetical protein
MQDAENTDKAGANADNQRKYQPRLQFRNTWQDANEHLSQRTHLETHLDFY